MGGSGAQFSGPASDEIQDKLRRAREDEESRLVSDINELLQSVLAEYNARDREEIARRLEVLADELQGIVAIEKTLYGGSVAKHTDIDGISDTDALVLLDVETGRGVSPSDVLERFRKVLQRELSRFEVMSIHKGDLAVTVKYADGEEVQLLPAVRIGEEIKIPDESGEGWSKIKPEAFRKRLTDANRKANHSLVPTIKLAKGIMESLPKERRLKGHHLEAVAIESMEEYDGPYMPRSMLLHVLEYASERVKSPIEDVTGQSEWFDGYLGEEGGTRRQRVSLALDGIRRRLQSATSVEDWKKVLDVSRE